MKGLSLFSDRHFPAPSFSLHFNTPSRATYCIIPTYWELDCTPRDRLKSWPMSLGFYTITPYSKLTSKIFMYVFLSFLTCGRIFTMLLIWISPTGLRRFPNEGFKKWSWARRAHFVSATVDVTLSVTLPLRGRSKVPQHGLRWSAFR